MAIPENKLNEIRGKCLVGHATPKELIEVFKVIDEMEMLLDEMDENDAFGTEGWRKRIGWSHD